MSVTKLFISHFDCGVNWNLNPLSCISNREDATVLRYDYNSLSSLMLMISPRKAYTVMRIKCYDKTGKFLDFVNNNGTISFNFNKYIDTVYIHATLDSNLVDSGPKIEFGQIWLDTRAILNYKGTVDTGILITIHAFDAAEKIRIYNVDTREQMVIDTEKIRTITGKPYGEKDDIVISTVKGNRYCRLLRGGTYTNIIGALSRDTDWFQISSGNNGFAFAAEKGADNLSVTFSYQNAYVGV